MVDSGDRGGDADDEVGLEDATDDASDAGRREVEVPLRLYKTITVCSTLIAIVGVLGGFVVLDVATDRAQADISEVSVGLSVLGLAMIAGGALTYAFASRFRAAGMGNAKGGTDEHSDNDHG